MSKMVTRCPQCQTSFRVTEEHLKIANGAVRCGSCLNVFQAKDHWVPDAPPTPPVAAPADRPAPRFTTPIPTPSFLQAADKLAAQSSTATSAGSATPATPPAPATATTAPAAGSKFQFDQSAIDTQPKGKFQFDQRSIDSGSAANILQEPDKRIPETVLTQAHARPVEDIGDDDRISDDIVLEGDEDEVSPVKAAAPSFGNDDDDYSSLFDEEDVTSVDSDDFESLLSGDFNDLDSLVENTPDHSTSATSDESWAKDLLDELEEESKPAPVNLSEVEDGRSLLVDYTNPTDVDVARKDLGFDKPSTFAISKPAQARPATEKAGSATTANSAASSTVKPNTGSVAPVFTGETRQPATSREELIAHIEPAPVEINRDTDDTAAAWKTTLAQTAICIGLVILLAAQYLFFQFDHLARKDGTRPMVALVCSVLSCTLPPSEAWRNIKVSNLVVRKHDSVANALVVDAILYNHAAHELPFPKLELYFNDLEQLPVASRRFEVAEYLAGELAGKTMMPPGRPIHIAFEIINPGEKAVNWRLDITPFE